MQQLLCFNISEDAFTFELYFIYFIICSIENEFTRTRARFTFGKKLCPLFLHIFQLMLGQNFEIWREGQITN